MGRLFVKMASARLYVLAALALFVAASRRFGASASPLELLKSAFDEFSRIVSTPFNSPPQWGAGDPESANYDGEQGAKIMESLRSSHRDKPTRTPSGGEPQSNPLLEHTTDADQLEEAVFSGAEEPHFVTGAESAESAVELPDEAEAKEMLGESESHSYENTVSQENAFIDAEAAEEAHDVAGSESSASIAGEAYQMPSGATPTGEHDEADMLGSSEPSMGDAEAHADSLDAVMDSALSSGADADLAATTTEEVAKSPRNSEANVHTTGDDEASEAQTSALDSADTFTHAMDRAVADQDVEGLDDAEDAAGLVAEMPEGEHTMNSEEAAPGTAPDSYEDSNSVMDNKTTQEIPLDSSAPSQAYSAAEVPSSVDVPAASDAQQMPQEGHMALSTENDPDAAKHYQTVADAAEEPLNEMHITPNQGSTPQESSVLAALEEDILNERQADVIIADDSEVALPHATEVQSSASTEDAELAPHDGPNLAASGPDAAEENELIMSSAHGSVKVTEPKDHDKSVRTVGDEPTAHEDQNSEALPLDAAEENQSFDILANELLSTLHSMNEDENLLKSASDALIMSQGGDVLDASEPQVVDSIQAEVKAANSNSSEQQSSQEGDVSATAKPDAGDGSEAIKPTGDESFAVQHVKDSGISASTASEESTSPEGALENMPSEYKPADGSESHTASSNPEARKEEQEQKEHVHVQSHTEFPGVSSNLVARIMGEELH